MMHNGEEASDAGSHGSRDSVADLSARDAGAIDDDSGADVDNENGTTIRIPLVKDITPCPMCNRDGRGVAFLNAKDINKHMKEVHAGKRVAWKCRMCGKEFPGLHNVLCHIPKCKGVENRVVKEFECNECGDTFDTARGLSIHEMHRHPVIRDAKRREERERVQGIPGRKNTVWTDEEIDKLRELNERYRNEKYPNVKIKEHLPNKTLKQISDKRRTLRGGRRVPRAADGEAVGGGAVPPEEDVDAVGRANRASGQINNFREYGSTESVGAERRRGAGDASPRLSMDSGSGTDAEGWHQLLLGYMKQIKVPDESELKVIDENLNEIIDNMGKDPETLGKIDKFIKDILTPALLLQDANQQGNGGSRGKENRGRNRKVKNNHTARSRFGYARCQELYNNCPKRLADIAVSGNTDIIEMRKKDLPPGDGVQQFYENLWGIRGPQVELFNGNGRVVTLDQACPLISVKEVHDRVNRIKGDSAGGPDNIRKCHLRRCGTRELLAKLFNALLIAGHYPAPWRINRTTLLPKPGKDQSKIENWRPITIGSMIARIYSGIIDGKIRNVVEQTSRQKGFTRENGCKNNTVLLDRAIAQMKVERGGVVTIVDISKAFDTVPHSIIKSSLTRKGIPDSMAEYIRGMYDACETKIKVAKGGEVPIRLRRGVKQGDPLSPLLFNLAVEPIIERINEETSGMSVGGENLAILAFADDMVLLAVNREEAIRQVRLLGDYLGGLGMSLAAHKCQAFQVVAVNKSWYLKDPELNVGEERLPYCRPDESITYLGAKMNPWVGLRRGVECPVITEAVRRVGKMKLKPHQKLEIIRTYLLPHFIHGLVACPPRGTKLKSLDNDVRQELKSILHLPSSVTDSLFYASRKIGGLGIPRLEHIIKLAVLRSAIKAEHSTDQALRGALVDGKLQTELKLYANSLRINWPANLDDVDNARRRLKRAEIEKWKNLKCQGQGVADFKNDKIGNTWLQNPTLLRPSRYLDALRLRTNTFGTRVVLKRANPGIDAICRRCHAMPETLAHVIGACIHTKNMRIKRHDDIKNLVADRVQKNCTVFNEPVVNVQGELKKPDLVIKDQGRLLVVDVTVRYENGASLRKAFKEKEDKYKETAEYIKNRTGCAEAGVVPIVVGSRGTIPNETLENLKKLKIKNKDILTISMIALRSSIEMANAFIDYDNVQ